MNSYNIGTHSSIRTGRIQRRLRDAVIPIPAPEDPCRCKTGTDAPHRAFTITEHDRILKEVTRCPRPHRTRILPGWCRPLYYPDLSSGLSSAYPSDINYIRQMPRIHGIEELTVLARSTASTERTAALRDRASAALRAQQRHAEHFRVRPPLPPCPTPHSKVSFVPVAPQTPCNPGTQRVDYSNPQH